MLKSLTVEKLKDMRLKVMAAMLEDPDPPSGNCPLKRDWA